MGNRLWSRNNLGGEGGLSELYGYDGLDRLIGFERGTLNGSNNAITGPPPADHLASRNWPAGSGLDKRGNWLTHAWSVQRDPILENHTETRTPNGVNEYLTRQVDSDPAVDLVHDAAGNLTDDGEFTYEYDAENRLVSVTDNATQTELLHVTYDALGRAIERTTQAGTIRYVYDAPGGVGASGYAVLQEYDDTGSLLREFVHAAGHTQPLAMIDYTDAGSQPAGVAETFYYLLDERGSVTAITDEAGSVVESYRYDAYGGAYVYDATGTLVASWVDNWDDVALTPSAIGNPYGFTGHRFSVAGLYETPFRAYSPYLGRWLQRDPIGYVDGVNLYEYVYSNPIGWIDLFGLHGVHLNPMGVVLGLFNIATVAAGEPSGSGGKVPKTTDGKPFDPTKWEEGPTHSEPATGKKYKGGTSHVREYTERGTGRKMYRHWIETEDGKIKHDHFRKKPPKQLPKPGPKPGGPKTTPKPRGGPKPGGGLKPGGLFCIFFLVLDAGAQPAYGQIDFGWYDDDKDGIPNYYDRDHPWFDFWSAIEDDDGDGIPNWDDPIQPPSNGPPQDDGNDGPPPGGDSCG